LGNLLVQIRARGEFKSLAELRQIVQTSSEIQHIAPEYSSAWDEAYKKFQALLSSSK
jgi:hypothetical protein